jgi:hypothetical protein
VWLISAGADGLVYRKATPSNIWESKQLKVLSFLICCFPRGEYFPAVIKAAQRFMRLNALGLWSTYGDIRFLGKSIVFCVISF